MIDDIISYVLTTIFKGTIYSGTHKRPWTSKLYQKVFSVLLNVKAQLKHAPVGRLMYASSGVPSHPVCFQQQDPFKMCKLSIFLHGRTVTVSHLFPCPLLFPI